MTVTSPPPIATPVPAKETPTPESTPTETAISGPSPEQIAANMAEWNTEFTDKERTWYQVTTDGRFVAVNKDGSTQDVPNFRYDEKLNVLWQLKPSVYLNKDIWVPITMGDTRPERKQDANGNTVLTGNINFPACAFERSTLTCRAETVWFNGEKVETISKAEAMLILHTWMQEIYQRTLASEGQAAADVMLEQKSPVRAVSGEREISYAKMGKSNGGSYITLYDGSVWQIRNSPPYRWFSNEIQLTDANGKFVGIIPSPFFTVAASEDGQTGLILAESPDGDINKLLVDEFGMHAFNRDEYIRTHLTKMQIPESVWDELTSIN